METQEKNAYGPDGGDEQVQNLWDDDQQVAGEARNETDYATFIKNEINGLNTHFPLSGGETEEDMGTNDVDEDDIDEEEDVADREHLDTNFPLSGGDAPAV